MRKKGVHKKNEKLRRARELRGWSQQKVAQSIGTSENQISRWENNTSQPSKFYQEQLCTLFDMNTVELGFLSEPKVKSTPVVQPTEETTKTAVLQAIIEAFEMLGGIDLNNQRRSLLQAALSLFGTPLVSYTGVAIEPLDMEEKVTRWDETIKTFWQLYFNGGIPVLEQCLPGLLLELSQAALPSSMYHKQAAALLIQAHHIDWVTSIQRQDYGLALKSISKAQVYADLIDDSDLRLSSIIREAHTYFHLHNPVKQLSIHKRGLQIAGASSPLVQSWLYLLVAENYAHFKMGLEASNYLDLAKKSLPDRPENYEAHAYVYMNQYMLANFETIVNLHLGQPHKALGIINQLTLSDVDPRQAELSNHRLAAFYELRDLTQACQQFPVAFQAASKSKSRLRMSEVYNVYGKMCITWPREKRVKQLEEVLH